MRRTSFQTDTLGAAITYAYDEVGNQISVTDPLGNTTTSTYDNRNRLVATTGAEAGSHLHLPFIQMTDSEGNTLAYTYDAAKRLDTVKKNAILQADYDYEAAGRRVKLTLGNGSYTEYTPACLPAGRYDAANRLTLLENKKSDATVISSFAYQMDNVGNRTRTTCADGDYIDYTYDELYRLTDETRTGATSYSQQFTYDAVGNRTQLVKTGQGGGQTINYTYNAGDQLLQAQDLAGPTTSYAYDDNGNMTQTAIGAQTAYYYHDFDNRLVSINRDNLFFAGSAGSMDETTRNHRRLAYGHSSARSPAFTKRQFLLRPDSPDVFIKATLWVWSSGFGLLLLAIVFCELPLLLYRLKYCRQRFDCVSAWPKRYSFFEKCLICLLLAFSFVLLNPETEVAYALPTSQAKYTYAPDGAITKFINDGANALAEYDNTNPPQMNLLATYVTPSTDFNISKTDATDTYFYTHDGLGSVRQLLDASETTQNDYDYNAFGESVLETEPVTNDFKYTGRRFDPESGIYYYRARYYDTAIGRFLQKDPLFVALAGLDAAKWLSNALLAYAYASNGPVNHRDPTGLVVSIAFIIAVLVIFILYALLWYLLFGPNPLDVAAYGGGAELGAGFGVGLHQFHCCDQMCRRWKAVYWKWCVGAFLSASIMVELASGFAYDKCPDGYSGWFFECGLPIVGVDFGSDIVSITSPYGNGIGCRFCYYTFLPERSEIVGKCSQE